MLQLTREEKESTNWFAELKRRNVYRVGIGYLVVSWGIIEVSDILIRALDLPPITLRLIIVLLPGSCGSGVLGLNGRHQAVAEFHPSVSRTDNVVIND